MGVSELRRKTLEKSSVRGRWRDAIAAARLRVGNQRLERGARLGGKLSGRDASLREELANFIHGGGGGCVHAFKILDFERTASFILKDWHILYVLGVFVFLEYFFEPLSVCFLDFFKHYTLFF